VKKENPAMRLAILGLTAGWLVVGLAWAGLLITLEQSDGGVRYPGSARLSESGFRLEALPRGRLQQSAVYHTADSWNHVLAWYARRLRPDLGRRPRLADGCFQFTDADSGPIMRHSIVITLCSRMSGVTIFVHRQLALPGWASSRLP
jgi:hypothetical protein